MTPEELAKIESLPGMTPAQDDKWIELAQQAVSGKLPVFYAHIPIGALVPFDLDYRPDLHPLGQMLLEEATEKAERGEFTFPVVYQRGYWFIVSGDYPMLFSAVNGRPDIVGCYVLGEISHPQVENVQRVKPEDVRQILGL